ncbi:MAG: hypothetical protein HYZ16_04175 [Bacteroidetes bacterium]|jgi:hypothetical protein|nr:hypothetical protein [Bacteroidota bacterium]
MTIGLFATTRQNCAVTASVCHITNQLDIFRFAQVFNTEAQCRTFLREQREKEGITCKKCTRKGHFYLDVKG